MNKLILATMLALTPFAHAAETDFSKTAMIRLSHDSTAYANAGICSSKFSYIIDTYIENVLSLDLNLVAKDPKGKVVYTEKVSQPTEDMTGAGGNTYGEFFLEDESICNSKNWSIEIVSAKFVYKDGHASRDLIKSKQIVASSFKPMQIIIPKK